MAAALLQASAPIAKLRLKKTETCKYVYVARVVNVCTRVLVFHSEPANRHQSAEQLAYDV